jgi:hypothetical protein
MALLNFSLLQRIMQEVVMQPDFVVLIAGTAAQLRVAREWELPFAADCPALHEFLPDGYGEEDFNLFCGHNSEFVLTREERRGLRELVPYHANAPEPFEIKAEDKALLPANTVTADNAQCEHQVALRQRVNSLVYLMATLFDPNLDTVEALRDRAVPVLHAQLRLVWDEWAKKDQERRSKLLAALQQADHRFDSRGDMSCSILSYVWGSRQLSSCQHDESRWDTKLYRAGYRPAVVFTS